MNDKTRRKELQEQYKESRPEAGVYRIVNTRTNKTLLGSTPNLAAIRSRMEFARSTGGGTLHYRLKDDIRQYGIEAFELEVLDVLETKPEMSEAQIRSELATLETLWREKLDPASLY
jgi:hypothetical protein